MISLANQELLAQAIESVKARRESQAQAAQAQHATVSAQRFDMAKTKMGLAAKSASKSTSAKRAKSKPKAAAVGNTQRGAQDITPYLESEDLMAMADRGQADDTAVADTNFAYATAAANAIRDSGDVKRAGAANVASLNDDAAGRGLYYSGIRRGAVGMAIADTDRRAGSIESDLEVRKTKQLDELAKIDQGRAQFAQAMIARAAENGMALPVNPYDGAAPAAATPAPAGASGARQRAAEAQRKSPSQNGAANVKGAVTLSKKQPVSAKLGAAPRPTSRIKPRPGAHRSKLKAVY